MARIVIRCQYTGHYVFTGLDTQNSPTIGGGRIYWTNADDGSIGLGS